VLFIKVYLKLDLLKLSNIICKENFSKVVQLVNQLKGYFYINPFMAWSFSITIFSFAGVPPLLGFFAKQQVLSAALNKGYIFLTLVAIITSVIGCVYYLSIIKEMFFYSSEYKHNNMLKNWAEKLNNTLNKKDKNFNNWNIIITINGFISFSISIITNIITLFIFINKVWLSMGAIMAHSLFIT